MIDWIQVKSLREEVGQEDFEEVVELFLEEVEEVVERLKQHPEKASLEGDLHFLKGSAMNLGFAAFSELCQDGEVRAAKGEADNVDLSKVLDCYQVSKIQFIKDLPKQVH